MAVFRFVRRHKILSALLVLASYVAGFLVWEEAAAVRGRFIAHFDLARGHYRRLGRGLPPRWIREYTQILQERYGIEWVVVAGCGVTESIVAYSDAYNIVNGEAAERKFGPGIFELAAAEAKKNFKR